MKVFLLVTFLTLACGQNNDLFMYDETDAVNRVFGPGDWDQVQCDDLEECVSTVWHENDTIDNA
jgi:hypothetical protein